MRNSLMAGLLAVFAAPLSGADATVSYPEGYRDWHHVKSMVIQQGHPLFETFGGIHHLYANPAAMKGYTSGKFPDGAVIAFDLLEAKVDGNALVEGGRKVLGVMQKDSRRFADTGGWGFEGFAGGDRTKPTVGANAKTACFDCHEAQKDAGYTFSARGSRAPMKK